VGDIDLDVVSGRVFWVLGPNGAGKTSLLRVIAGLDSPRRGRVVRTGERLLYFQSEMGLPRSSTVGSWDRLLRRLGPGSAAAPRTSLWPDVEPRRRIGRLSTGQRKRLLLDAILRQPGPLVLDEPFEHLSPDAKTALHHLLRERALREEVIVATNQRAPLHPEMAGVRLQGGAAAPLQSAAVGYGS
jgi:ABC-2 type transport system ATP-binding protein